MLNQSDNELILYMAGCSLAKTKENDNWVDDTGGLPEYLCRIARAILRGDKSKSVSTAIAIAVGRAKVWARGGGGVTAKTSVKAAKAVAEWETKKKAAKADNKIKASNANQLDIDLTTTLTDAQLEKAALIPCTRKDTMSLMQAVALAHKLKDEGEFLKAHANNPNILALTAKKDIL